MRIPKETGEHQGIREQKLHWKVGQKERGRRGGPMPRANVTYWEALWFVAKSS